MQKLTRYSDAFQFYNGPVNGSKRELDSARGLDTSTGLTTKSDENPMSLINTR